MRKVSLNNTYTADAKVGNEIFKDVEYNTFEHINDYIVGNNSKTFGDKLEDFWISISWPFYRFKSWLKDIYRKTSYCFQRMFKGYDAVDTFELFAKFAERYENILKEYKANHYGYPADMTLEEWEAVIDKMIYHLHYMNENNVEKELKKNVPEDWHPSSLTVYKIMEQHKNEFFVLFSKYFYNLWD